MTAGTEVVCNDVVRKVEIEDKCVAGLDASDLNKVGASAAVDGNVGGNGNGSVGGDGKDDTDDSSCVFVTRSNEATAGDPVDTGGVNVNVDVIVPKSDSADEVEQIKKEELGTENGGIPVDPSVLETNLSATDRDADVQVAIEEVNLENGSTVDSHVVLETNGIVQDSVNGLGKTTGEEGEVVKRTDEADEVNGMTNVEAKTDDIGSGVKFDPESTLNTIESTQVTVFELESTIKPSEESKSQVTITQSVSTRDVIKTTDESLSNPNPIRNTDSEVTVNDGPESVNNLIDKAEYQVTVDGSESTGKPTEDVECQVTADGSESAGTPIKERECQVSVDVLGSSGNFTENIDSTMTVMESARKSEEHHKSLIMTSEVNVEAEPNPVCSGIKAEHQSELVSTPYPFENRKTEGTEIRLGTESEENPSSVVVLSEAADAPANGQVETSDGIVEQGETQMSQTEADERVLLEFNAEKAKSEEQLEKQVEGSSEKFVNITESVEFEAKFEETKEQVKIEDEIQESQIVVTGNIQNDLNLEDNAAQSASEAEAPLETETTIEPITENTASQYEEANICVDKTQTGIQQKTGAENAEILPSTDSVKSECKNGELLVEKDICSLSNPDDLTVVEQKVEFEAHLVTENSSGEGMDFGTGTENVDVCDDVHTETEVKDAPVGDHSTLSKQKVAFEAHLVTENTSGEGMDFGTGTENVDVCDDEHTETEVKDAPVGDHSTLSFPDTNVNPGTVIEFGSIGRHETVPNIHNDDVIVVPDVVNGETKSACGADSDNPERHLDGSHEDRSSDKVSCPEVEDMDGVQSDEIPSSSIEGSVSDAIDVQNEEAEVLPYNFLIRIPRFEDEMFRDQIKSAQLQVDEKTRLRDAIRAEIQGKRARLKAHNEAFNAAKLEETAARRLVRLKRQEIDSVQSVINRVKNAMSVEDIDGRIYNMEHMIQHETLCLKDEKQFIREIKQLKTLRDQLASNMGSQDEVQQALDQKDQIEDRMKTLRKELDSLKDKVSKAEAAVIAVGKKYDEESRRERELQAQFRAADDVRQRAYAHLNSLKKQSYDKNKDFRMYKDDVMAARDFASRGDKDALHRLCANQVEAFMEQWNSNDEFRKEYVSRCNMNASRRQRSLDGRSLGPDEVSLLLPNNVNERIDRSQVSIPGEVKSTSEVSAVEQVTTVSSVEDKHADNKSIENVSGQKNQTAKTKDLVKSTFRSESATVTERDEAIDNRKEEEKTLTKEEEKTLTKEEMELARKAEELRKEEIAAKLKEHRRLEEKAKAIEALERKKRNAEKAQVRAELRARKEAEQKEKEREKRLRKKEKKKGGGDGSNNGEEAANSESSNEATTKEIEGVKENGSLMKKRPQKAPPHFFSKQLKPKPIPPPLANRNKKRWQQWGKVLIAAAVVLALFLLGNTGFFLNLRLLKANGSI